MKITTTGTPLESMNNERNSSSTNKDRLDTWKEIACYLNRNVRTVQRWEACETMPVHRHLHAKSGSVHAFRSELDAWRRTRSYCGPRGCAQTRLTQRSEKGWISDKEYTHLRSVLKAILVQLATQTTDLSLVSQRNIQLQNRDITERSKTIEDFTEPSMAAVLHHIHSCPRCNDTWTCVSWVCEKEDDDLICLPCRIKSRDESLPQETFGTVRGR